MNIENNEDSEDSPKGFYYLVIQKKRPQIGRFLNKQDTRLASEAKEVLKSDIWRDKPEVIKKKFIHQQEIVGVTNSQIQPTKVDQVSTAQIFSRQSTYNLFWDQRTLYTYPSVLKVGQFIVVFAGYLTNLNTFNVLTPEIKKYLCENMEGSDSKERKQIKGGKLSYAELCLYLYLSYKKDSQLLISELQGRFSLVIYDGKDNRTLMYRTAYSESPIFVKKDEHGLMHISNFMPNESDSLSKISSIGSGGSSSSSFEEDTWRLLSPGKCICKKVYQMSLEDVFQAHELEYDKLNVMASKSKNMWKYVYS